MLRRFIDDRRGAYAIAFVVAMVPLMGGLALAVDFAEMNRQKQATMNALDAAAIATARQAVSGATDAELVQYAEDFFVANLGPVNPATTALDVRLPNDGTGGGTLKLSATLDYEPHLLPAFKSLMRARYGGERGSDTVSFSAVSEVRLKNTLEVALVLDNSGSMDDEGDGSGERRIDLLKAAAKELVTTLSEQAKLIKQVNKPVQFALVPFAGSVNVGPDNADADWMDKEGKSPIHHENFDWSTMTGDRRVEKDGDVYKKRGEDWAENEKGEIVTRFTLFDELHYVSERECVDRRGSHCDEWEATEWSSYTSWNGCVEARPYPYNVNDSAPDATLNGDPATLFVPMFAPDEPGDVWETEDDEHPDDYDASNNWWNDGTEGSKRSRLVNMAKYYEPRPYDEDMPDGTGPDYSCTTKPLTPLEDVTTETGMTTINDAIDDMEPDGATDVPQGMVWGWRLVSGGEPFRQGRPDGEKGNDKVVIVLTDGKNTYYTPGSLGYDDPADRVRRARPSNDR